MNQQQPDRRPSSGGVPLGLLGVRIPVGLFALLLLIGLLGALVTLFGALPIPGAPAFHHTPPAVNTGKSILYLSSPTFAAQPTQLTMVRTSDGTTLWQYDLSGVLSTGQVPTINQALDAGQALQIVNGMIYFVVDPNHLGAPNRIQHVMALRASDGGVVWQQDIQAGDIELLGASDGVVCVRTLQQQGANGTQSTLYGFDAVNGSSNWQRQLSDIVGASSPYGAISSPVLLDGILYAIGADLTMHALQASTGQTLWDYRLGTVPGAVFSGVAPVASTNGIAVLYHPTATSVTSSNASASLIGIQERDGKVLWTAKLGSIAANLPFGGPNARGILERAGALYFVTTDANDDLWLNNVRVADGKVLWQHQISTGKHILWNLAVNDGGVYADVALPFQGMHPTYEGLTVTAVSTETGAQRWSDQPSAKEFDQISATSDVILLLADATLAGADSTFAALRASDGAVLWQHTLDSAPVLSTADGLGILSSVTSTGPTAWTGTLCGLEPATGTMRWCKQFPTGLAAVILGP